MIALCPFTKIAWPRRSGYSARTTPTQKTHKYLEMHASRNFLNEKQEHEQSDDGCVGQAESLVADGEHCTSARVMHTSSGAEHAHSVRFTANSRVYK